MTGYESEIVLAFIKDHREGNELNGVKMLNDQLDRMLPRWAASDVVALYKVDKFLMRHGLMLFELEHWAQQHYGRDGFVDTKELVG